MDGLLMGPMASYHFDRNAGYNEVHPALGYMTPDGWAAGVYKNSLGKNSVYAGKEFRYPLLPWLDANLQAGVVTGYDKPLLPALMPGLIGKFGNHEMNLMLMPPSEKTGKGGLALQYRRKLK